MKICIINGSPKKNSITLRLAFNFCKDITDEVEIINLKDQNLKICNGCMRCYHAPKCVISDDLDMILEKIGSSDLIVFASPTYLFNVSTLMKIFIDRTANWGYKSSLCGKPSVIVSSADGIGTKNCISSIKKLAYFSGALPICSLYCYLYEFKDKNRLTGQKKICLKKINKFFDSRIYKPGFDYLYYFNIKRSYIITAKKRFYEEYGYWITNQSGDRFFYPVKEFKIRISFIKKIYSAIVSFFIFFNYKYSGKYK